MFSITNSKKVLNSAIAVIAVELIAIIFTPMVNAIDLSPYTYSGTGIMQAQSCFSVPSIACNLENAIAAISAAIANASNVSGKVLKAAAVYEIYKHGICKACQQNIMLR